ncbi:hypothetical protein BGZ91_008425 [Linnemannia elongata]|nr:hypothetical protein BGZ91_008425 [Linnemannia elongata]
MSSSVNKLSDHTTTSQNALEDSTARNERRIMSRLEVLLAHEHGKTVIVPCKESDTIETVLKWVRNRLGINLDDLYQDDLYVNGRLIQSKNETIGKSRIFGHVLTYHHRIKNPSLIYLKMPSGKVLELKCRLDTQAEYLQYAIADRIGSTSDRLRLFYNGERLAGKITLAEHGVQECCQHDMATVVGVGFVECQYRFFGIRNSGEQVSSGWKSTEGNRYARLDPGEMFTGWRRLIFESAEIGEVDDCSICLFELSRVHGEFDGEWKIEECGQCGLYFHTGCLQKYTAGVCPGCDLNKHLVGGCP